MKTRILIFTLSIFSCLAARAELKWEQTTIEVHPAVGDKAAVAHFKYENTGKTAVHLKSVKASCGCTATQTQREVVNPGEKGEITATFNFGDRVGPQPPKTVTVQTDDPPPAQSTITLTLHADIPQSVEVKPNFIYWTTGEAPKSKKVWIKAAKDFPVKNINVKSNSQNFESKVEPGKSGEWTVEVTPKDTSHPMGTALLIETDYPKDAPKKFYVNAMVQAPPGAPPTLRPNPPPVAPAVKSATPAAVPSPAVQR